MLEVGTIVFGHFEILHCFERGAQDGVFLARHQDFPDSPCTLKIMKLTESSIDDLSAKRFRNEILVTYELQHRNIIRSRGYHRDGQILGLEMEYLSLGSLRDLISSKQPVSAGQVVYLLGEALNGLSMIHQSGIIHRDVRPENVLFGSKGEIKITDFGAARVGATISTGSGITGKLEYLSPEYVKDGTLTPSSDIYSLGICAYELVTGRKPYKAESPIRALALRLTQEIVPPSEINPECPPELSDLIVTAMAVEPSHRFQSAGEMVQALNEFSINAGVKPELLMPKSPPKIAAIANLGDGAASIRPESTLSGNASGLSKREQKKKKKQASKLVNKAFGQSPHTQSSGLFSIATLKALFGAFMVLLGLALFVLYYQSGQKASPKTPDKTTTNSSYDDPSSVDEEEFAKGFAAKVPPGYYVEYLASSSILEAADTSASLDEAGFPLQLQTILEGDYIMYRVYIGPFFNQEEVDKSMEELQRKGLFRPEVELKKIE